MAPASTPPPSFAPDQIFWRQPTPRTDSEFRIGSWLERPFQPLQAKEAKEGAASPRGSGGTMAAPVGPPVPRLVPRHAPRPPAPAPAPAPSGAGQAHQPAGVGCSVGWRAAEGGSRDSVLIVTTIKPGTPAARSGKAVCRARTHTHTRDSRRVCRPLFFQGIGLFAARHADARVCIHIVLGSLHTKTAGVNICVCT